MTQDRGGVSRRDALRLVLGQGAEMARERDRIALAQEQETALEAARGARAAPPAVETLAAGQADELVDVLAESFRDYPVMRFVLGGDDAPERLRALVRLFVMGRVLRGDPLLGMRRGTRLVAGATASHPGAPPPPEFLRLRGQLWKQLGADAEARYDAYVAAASGVGVDLPRVHLNMVGVVPAERGAGLARGLIDEVQRISRERQGSQGVTLTTEDPANVEYYRKLGFEVTGHARVAPELETWGFLRRD